MTEEELLDRLTADRDRSDPDWDRDSRIEACREALVRQTLGVHEATVAFGSVIVVDALEEMKKRISAIPYTDEKLVDVARAMNGRGGRRIVTEHRYFDGGHEYGRRLAMAACVMTLTVSGLIAGMWLESSNTIAKLPETSVTRIIFPERVVEVNSDASGSETTGSLKFSVPETAGMEKRLEEAVKIVESSKPLDILLEEIEKSKSRIEGDIIVQEARRRAAARLQQAQTPAVPKTERQSMRHPATFDVGSRSVD